MSITKNYQLTKGTCKVTFSYPVSAAQGAKSVQILGDFNNWDAKSAPKMKKGKDEFSGNIEVPAGKIYQFRYLLDGKNWDNDHQADNYAPAPYAGIKNSVLIVDAIQKPKATKAAPAKEVKTVAVKEVATKTAKTAKTVVAKTAAPKVAVAKAPKKAVATKAAKVAKAVAPKAPKKA
ncbi:MAG: isoamylase early set domain-containing protein [Saprospiraceae bacterium]